MKTPTTGLMKFPPLTTHQEAEDFLENADLLEFDLSTMKPVRFELAPKDERLTIRVPATLLAQLKAEAKKLKMPYGRFIRMKLEHSLEN